MKKAINYLFWGYLLVFVRIDVGIDLLPVPLGYLLIATGCSKLEKRYPVMQKAWAYSTIMIFLSVPTVFLDVYKEIHILWKSYGLLIVIFQLIVVYFLLRGLKLIVKEYGNPISSQRLKRFTNVYIASYLLYLTAETFTLNYATDDWLLMMVYFSIFIFILNIIFLVSLRIIRKKVPISIERNED